MKAGATTFAPTRLRTSGNGAVRAVHLTTAAVSCVGCGEWSVDLGVPQVVSETVRFVGGSYDSWTRALLLRRWFAASGLKLSLRVRR